MNQGMSNLILLANYQLPAVKDSKNQNVLLLWRGGVVGIITVQLHSTMPELSLCAGSNPATCRRLAMMRISVNDPRCK